MIDRERWRDFNQVWEAHRAASSKIAERWHQSADALSQMMLNTAFVLNAGGIVAVPALHQFLYNSGRPSSWELAAGFTFFVGIVFAAISGVATIWNYRMVALNNEESSAVTAKEIEEKWHAEGTFSPSEELRLLQQTPRVGSRSIPLTFVVGWGFGTLSFLCFAIGGSMIAACSNSKAPKAELSSKAALISVGDQKLQMNSVERQLLRK